ncbi:MAG: hypothetical protein IJP75_09605 [Bacteroidaceae bacterium]|jgi:hypothetical protein|nr:hypothetical protein [Bacteroidaceae bacterium]
MEYGTDNLDYDDFEFEYGNQNYPTDKKEVKTDTKEEIKAGLYFLIFLFIAGLVIISFIYSISDYRF